MKSYQDINSETIDKWIEEGWLWGIPISHETYIKARDEKEWDVLLTPTKYVPHSWFCEFKGAKILGLASGGAQQMPIFTALGAECTVLDYSAKQIESELKMAESEGYGISAIRADMTKPLPFEDESFDLIFHPVSNIYVRKVDPIFAECYRVLKKGGILLCGLDNGINYIVNDDETEIVYPLPFDPLKDIRLKLILEKANEGIQFSHTADEQIGGQLRAGFRLTDLYEDTNGFGRLHEMNIPSFWATRAIK